MKFPYKLRHERLGMYTCDKDSIVVNLQKLNVNSLRLGNFVITIGLTRLTLK